MKKLNALMLLAAALALPGCAPKGCRTDRSSGLAQALPAPTYGSATLSGVVRFDGAPPAMKPIPEAAQCGGLQAREEWAIIDGDGGLANVLIYLDDAPRSTGLNRAPVVLDQIDCTFRPHVVGVQVEQPLITRSSDVELHNVHYQPKQNSSTNFSLGSAEQRTVSFARAEVGPVEVKCDVHPWMTAYIGVFAHPFYAVTDESGRYSIERVPAGRYTLRAWHERFGTRQETIVVADAGTVTKEFVFARRGG